MGAYFWGLFCLLGGVCLVGLLSCHWVIGVVVMVPCGLVGWLGVCLYVDVVLMNDMLYCVCVPVVFWAIKWVCGVIYSGLKLCVYMCGGFVVV